MITNFKIINPTEIEFNGQELDLHNNYDFKGFIHDKDTNQISLHFDKSKGDWVLTSDLNKLTFTFTNIKYFKAIVPNANWLEDDSCLAGITFFPADNREENYGFIDQTQAKLNDDIIFTFESDRAIRISCDTVSLTVV